MEASKAHFMVPSIMYSHGGGSQFTGASVSSGCQVACFPSHIFSTVRPLSALGISIATLLWAALTQLSRKYMVLIYRFHSFAGWIS